MKQISVAALAIFLIWVYWASALNFLDRTPTVHEDEPWIASTSWAIATRGIFGSTLFAGMDGMETHYYEFLPLYPLIQAVLFRFAGIGLFQARFVSVSAGALTLALTYALGRRLFGETVGVVALPLLMFTRSLASIPALPTGILFFDGNRLARYDAFVPVLGLAALHLFLTARARQSIALFGAAGFVSAVAGLTHVYGAFWGIALGVLALWERVHPRALLALAVGFLAPWLAYGLYVLSDLNAWLAQLHWSRGRFELLNPSWYINNVLSEGQRYDLIGMRLPARLGAWFNAWSIVIGGLILTWRSSVKRDSNARALIVPFWIIAALFALLINSKIRNYALTLAPLAALMVAWGSVALWNALSHIRYGRSLRIALASILLLVMGEGIWGIGDLQSAAGNTIPYSQLAANLHAKAPAGTRVLGLHSAWFGFQDTDYRNVLVIIDHAQHQFVRTPAPLAAALDEFNPQAILIDPRLDVYIRDSAETDPFPHALQTWMQQHHFSIAAQVYDAGHGTYRLYTPTR